MFQRAWSMLIRVRKLMRIEETIDTADLPSHHLFFILKPSVCDEYRTYKKENDRSKTKLERSSGPMCYSVMAAVLLKGVFYVAENVSGLMLVSPSAPVGRVIKVRSLVRLYGKSACHTTPPKWGPMYRRARVQFLETGWQKCSIKGSTHSSGLVLVLDDREDLAVVSRANDDLAAERDAFKGRVDVGH